MKPSILFIVPAEYKALKTKGVESMIYERDEMGFFKKVITVHPFCTETRIIHLNNCHEIHEVGFDWIPGAKKFQILKYAQFPTHFFRVILKVVSLAKKNRVDLIRANDPFWIGFFAYLGAKLSGLPYCVSIHADFDKRMELDKNIRLSTVFGSYHLAKKLSQLVFKNAALVLPIRESLSKIALTNCADPRKIKVMPHGIDLDALESIHQYSIHNHFGIAPEIKILSFVGRLVTENYTNDLLLIAKRLAQTRTDFVILIAGGGKQEAELKKEVYHDPVLRKIIHLLGFQSRKLCFQLRRESTASLCLMGGFSLIEACAAGRPVISYDVEWHSELVKNGETGFLLAENDVNGVVAALCWIFDNPDESVILGTRAKNLAKTQHSLTQTSQIKVKYYSEIIAKKK